MKILSFKKEGATTQKLLALASLVVMIIVFSILKPVFISFNNIMSVLLSTCVTGVLALGVTFVIITGGIDLSVGTVMTFSSVIAALAMMMITKGLSLVLTRARPIYFTKVPAYRDIALGSIFGIEGLFNAILIFVVAIVIATVILSKTLLGRYCYAIGSNKESARLSGIPVDRWVMAIYSLCGAFCAIAGILMSSRLDSAQPALGPGYEMEAIAAAVIGGTSLSGGEGGMVGTVIGAFIMSVLINGLRILSVPQEWQLVATGLILALAVYIDLMRRRKEV